MVSGSLDKERTMKKKTRLISSPEGTGEVTLKDKHIATVEYHLRCYQDVAEIHTGAAQVHEVPGPLDIHGTVEVMECQSWLILDELYTLYLGDKREIDFKATSSRREGSYSIVGQSDFRKS
jgi:hypothetical protein